MNDLISIIIANYNGKIWLKKLFDSLLVQTYKNFEIIFADNASSDDSIEFIENNYSDDRIKIIKSEKNLGFSGGNNLGFENSKGRYLLFINTDVWMEANFLQNLWSFYESHAYNVVAPLAADYFTQKKLWPYTSTIDYFGYPVYLPTNKSVKRQSFYLTGLCLFVSSQLYRESLGFDDNFFMYSEDVDWFWRLNLLNKNVSYIDGLFIYHPVPGSTNICIKDKMFLWRNQNTLQMLLKNYQWFNLIWILPVYILQNIIEIIFFILIFKPRISYSYIQGWWFNVVNIRKIMQKRKWVQENRKVNDLAVMKNMYHGFGKVRPLFDYLRMQRRVT